MPRKAGFSGLTEVEALSDAELRSLVLGNWEKLNRVLMTRPPASSLRRLLRLELTGQPSRTDILTRLRVALNRANGLEASAALKEVLAVRAQHGICSGQLLERALK